jgi:hypothetical protein
MRKNQQIHQLFIHNILSTAPQLSISQKALGTLPDDGNVMPKHVGPAVHNLKTELIIGVFIGISCIFLLRILIFKGLTALHLYKSFRVKGLIR